MAYKENVAKGIGSKGTDLRIATATDSNFGNMELNHVAYKDNSVTGIGSKRTDLGNASVTDSYTELDRNAYKNQNASRASPSETDPIYYTKSELSNAIEAIKTVYFN